MNKYIYEIDKKTGKQYKKYLGSDFKVEVKPHDGKINEEKLFNGFINVLIHKMKTDKDFKIKISNDAQTSYQQYYLSESLSECDIKMWKKTPKLEKANYKWWKLWLLPLVINKNKEIRDAQEKMRNDEMHPKEVKKWLKTRNSFWTWINPPLTKNDNDRRRYSRMGF